MAAHLLEAAPADLEIGDGAVRVRGLPDRGVPLAQVARLGNAGVAYDEQGQCLASSFLDYPLPSAREMPRVEMFHLTTPSPINPLGVKGAGEAGTLPVPAAVAVAVEDALRPFGVRVTRMPLSPARISDLIQGA